MEQQQPQQTMSLGESAIRHVANERFMQRQKLLEHYIEAGTLPSLEGVVMFQPGTKLTDGSTVEMLRKWFEQTIAFGFTEHIQTVYAALEKLRGGMAADECFIVGDVFGYTDHPDGNLRIELQLSRAPAHGVASTIPDLVLTFTLRESEPRDDDGDGKTVWTVVDVKEGRIDWHNMPLQLSKKEVAADAKTVDPAAVQAVDFRKIFVSHDQRLGKKSKAAAPIVKPAEVSVVDDDGMMSLFAPSPEKIAQMKQPQEELPVAEQQALLFSRGYPMSMKWFATIDGLALDIRTQDDAKYFLDELFRHGNLWLHNQIEATLKANEMGRINEVPLVFELSVKGNWQEKLGPVNAKIKLKAFAEKDTKRENKLFTISGSM